MAIYTCDPVILTIGYMNNSIFILDTHPIAKRLGGNGTGILKVFPYVDDREGTCEGISYWIWQQLVSAGVPNTAYQSLAVVKKVSR